MLCKYALTEIYLWHHLVQSPIEKEGQKTIQKIADLYLSKRNQPEKKSLSSLGVLDNYIIASRIIIYYNLKGAGTTYGRANWLI